MHPKVRDGGELHGVGCICVSILILLAIELRYFIFLFSTMVWFLKTGGTFLFGCLYREECGI